MVNYPTATYILEANKIALAMTKDKHPHKLLIQIEGIQSLIDEVKNCEGKGLTYQAACFMRDIVILHPFDGANHRTGYLVTLLFLTQNGMSLRDVPPKVVDEFMKEIGTREIADVQVWIEQNML
jgi:prophage maintenance system killer protein